MIDVKIIKEALCGAILVTQSEDGVRVTTHCLYPSNGTVTITVRGGINDFFVTDDGDAISQASSAGLMERATDRQIRTLLKPYGLNVKNGIIFTPPVGISELPAAILLVANAAKDVATWSLDHLRFDVRRNFKAELSALLDRHFHDNLKSIPIVGSSNRHYHFDHVIHLKHGKRLIVDPVVNDASSINARVVANLDVRMAGNSDIEQLIVYDDFMEWTSADLKVLEVGARVVPFSFAEDEVSRLVA